MKTINTKDIQITVETFYREKHSKHQQYVFSYRITIKNYSKETVKLLKRHWLIADSAGGRKEVKGNGVIGKQPTLLPNESHSYESWCPFRTDVGKMSGSFLMKRMSGRKGI